jgi:hypothetical protein
MRIKNSLTPHLVSAPLEAVGRRLARWRGAHKHRSPLPEALWDAAVTAARECGLNRTARTLRLDYYSLKKRVESANPDGSARQEIHPQFVEFVPPAPNCFPVCTVELEHPRGTKMRIHLKGAGAPDLVGLTRAFWSAER